MTVTKGKQKYSFPSSSNTSDVELQLNSSLSDSEPETLNNGPVAPRSFVPKPRHTEELLVLKKGSGRKKLRRFQNSHQLQTLAEEDEDEGTLVVIMEPYKSPFAKLLQDQDALEFWNVFINKSEEEQTKIVNNFSKNRLSPTAVRGAKERPFSRISAKIRRTIKFRKNLPLEVVKRSEDELITFFRKSPKEIYQQSPPSYFERLILHAIAQYHGLHSLGIIENGVKKVEIFNNIEEWIPADCFLTDFVAQLRS